MKRLTTKNEHRQWDFGEYMPNWEAICAMTGRGTHDYTFALKVSLDKLGQYEDTGLTPEDVVAMYRTIEQVKLPLWKIRELADAEDEGRLVKLPCKQGDFVWCVRGMKYSKHVKRIEVHGVWGYEGGVVKVLTTLEDILGKTAFLTKEEAEQKAEQLNRRNKV